MSSLLVADFLVRPGSDEHLVLTGAHRRCVELAASPLLASRISIDLSTNHALDEEDIIALAASPHLQRLRWLNLSKTNLNRAAIEALAAATRTRLPALRYLGLVLNPVPDPCDERIDWDGGAISWQATPFGNELEAAHGDLPWLHCHELVPTAEKFR